MHSIPPKRAKNAKKSNLFNVNHHSNNSIRRLKNRGILNSVKTVTYLTTKSKLLCCLSRGYSTCHCPHRSNYYAVSRPRVVVTVSNQARVLDEKYMLATLTPNFGVGNIFATFFCGGGICTAQRVFGFSQ